MHSSRKCIIASEVRFIEEVNLLLCHPKQTKILKYKYSFVLQFPLEFLKSLHHQSQFFHPQTIVIGRKVYRAERKLIMVNLMKPRKNIFQPSG